MSTSSLIARWKESFELFEKNNRKLYLLGTLNVFIKTTTLITKKFWWFFGFILIPFFFIVPYFFSDLFENITAVIAYEIVRIFMGAITVYLTVMTTRPSLEAKNYNYFIKYSPAIWAAFAVTALAPTVFFTALAPLTLLFFFDSKQRFLDIFVSIFQALKVYFYFLPAITAVVLVATLIELVPYLISLILPAMPIMLQFTVDCFMVLVMMLLQILTFSAITVYYIRIKHAHHSTLFGK